MNQTQLRPKIKLKKLIMKAKTPTFIEVCAGTGGLSAGLIKAGFRPLLLNEIDNTCCQTLKVNHPGVKIDCGSMSDLDLSSYKNQVDLLAGGVPCQSYSMAGHRKGLNDPRGDLILQFRDLIDQVQPKVFLIENVKGLVNHDDGKTFTTVLANLNRSNDYDIQYQVLNAWDYDVPQKRERVIIIGTQKSLQLSQFKYPTPSLRKPVLKDVLPGCPPSQGCAYSTAKQAVMILVPPGGCWVDLPQDVQKSYMGQSLNSGGGKRGMARRLSMDEPSLTLTTSPNQKQTERAHPNENRPLSIREYARIQTFPDSYQFCGSISSQYKQIGNAVPVELANYLGKSIKSYLKY
jgi:DNA (cytosine-5)-methyltransferase 1